MNILIVEDELLIALDLQDALLELGHTVAAIAPDSDTAVRLGEIHRPDLALVDIRLGATSCGIDAARRLKRSGISSLYVTGTVEDARFGKDAALACIGKPLNYQSVLAPALAWVEDLVRGQGSSSPRIGMEIFDPVSPIPDGCVGCPLPEAAAFCQSGREPRAAHSERP